VGVPDGRRVRGPCGAPAGPAYLLISRGLERRAEDAAPAVRELPVRVCATPRRAFTLPPWGRKMRLQTAFAFVASGVLAITFVTAQLIPTDPCWEQFKSNLGDCATSWGAKKEPCREGQNEGCESDSQRRSREMLLAGCIEGAKTSLSRCYNPPKLEPEPKQDAVTMLSPNVLIATVIPIGQPAQHHLLRFNDAEAGSYKLVLTNGLPDDQTSVYLYRTAGSISINGTVVDSYDASDFEIVVPITLVAGENTFEVVFNKEESAGGFGFVTGMIDGRH
jgi:hypothetical protein